LQRTISIRLRYLRDPFRQVKTRERAIEKQGSVIKSAVSGTTKLSEAKNAQKDRKNTKKR
jgi:hypothetical protein